MSYDDDVNEIENEMAAREHLERWTVLSKIHVDTQPAGSGLAPPKSDNEE